MSSSLIKLVQYLKFVHPKKSLGALIILGLYLLDKYKHRSKSLTNQIVLITGGASGLGKLMAKQFVLAGSRVVLWDINPNALETVTNELNELNGGQDRQVYGYVCDVSDSKEVYRVGAQVKAEIGDPSILVNNAGVVCGNWITDISDEGIKRTFGVNTLASFWTIRAFLPEMIRANRGHIVTIASAAGIVGCSKLTDYCSSKFAAVGLNEALRNELNYRGLTNIKTTCVCPFYINTGMFDGVQTNFLLPMLEEKYVVNQIMNAIRTDREIVQLPFLVSLVPLLRLLPVWMFDGLGQILKINQSMESFNGRSIDNKSSFAFTTNNAPDSPSQ